MCTKADGVYCFSKYYTRMGVGNTMSEERSMSKTDNYTLTDESTLTGDTDESTVLINRLKDLPLHSRDQSDLVCDLAQSSHCHNHCIAPVCIEHRLLSQTRSHLFSFAR